MVAVGWRVKPLEEGHSSDCEFRIFEESSLHIMKLFKLRTGGLLEKVRVTQEGNSLRYVGD